MSPRVESFPLSPQETRVIKVGGSIIFLPNSYEFDADYVPKLIDILGEEVKRKLTVVAVVGGGSIARLRGKNLQSMGVDEELIERVGIGITINNARALASVTAAKQIPWALKDNHESEILKEAINYRGGSEPGHTTDFVAVKTAIDRNQTHVIIMTTGTGLYRRKSGQIMEGDVVPNISLSEYIDTMAVKHSAGVHTPVGKPAAELARDNNISIVLIGPDLDNLKLCLNGEEFLGSILHP